MQWLKWKIRVGETVDWGLGPWLCTLLLYTVPSPQGPLVNSESNYGPDNGNLLYATYRLVVNSSLYLGDGDSSRACRITGILKCKKML